MDKSEVGWHAPVIPGMLGSINRRITVHASLGKKPYLQNNQCKQG
jgi:hypothetical protein